MKETAQIWKEKLKLKLPEEWAKEIDEFETILKLRKEGKLDEKLFAETRLRRGVYGQRYDNGLRHDGIEQRTLAYNSKIQTKGPHTLWDAPGMQRIKIPYGGLKSKQLEVLADLAEEYSDGIAHVTTRQDIQFHYVHIDDSPTIMRRLAAVGITTREACGNSVRNVTACPYAGVCPDEAFDVTPYAKALTFFLLGHPDTQDFGRKFKPSLGGCKRHACGLANMHDLGLIATTRQNNGKEERGFEMYVGGGLGPVPHQAKLLSEFVPPEELLPLAQSIARIFTRMGEKKNRNRARLKFLVKDLGIEKFRDLVFEEREKLPHDPRWTDYLADLEKDKEGPKEEQKKASSFPHEPQYQRWLETNTRSQIQDGFATVTIALPLGDITPNQLRGLAKIARKYTEDTIRTTVEQNMVLRWIRKDQLPSLYQELKKVGLAQGEAGHILDIVACPGTDTCKLGISSSRGLASELRRRLGKKNLQLDEAVRDLHIKISGCFNSCGQHHIADLGFYGINRKVAGYMVPYFQVVLGGEWENNAGSYGLSIVAIPSKNIPEVVDRMTDLFLKKRKEGESFKNFVLRIGKVEIKKLLEDLTKPPDYLTDPSFYSDWGDPREFNTGDVGIGECAGEVVSPTEFELAEAERELFEAQVLLDDGKSQEAGENALRSMLYAARGLLKMELPDAPEDPIVIVSEFRSRFYETEKFFDPYMGGKFAQYLFTVEEKASQPFSLESAHHTIEEAHQFIEASHRCYIRLSSESA